MTQLSKTMQQAVDTVRRLPPEQQDFLAVELMKRAHVLTLPPTQLAPAERAELEAELAAAKRGEFASEAEVAAMYAKHGL